MRILMILLLVGGAAGGLWYLQNRAPIGPQTIGVYHADSGIPMVGILMIADSKTGSQESIGKTDRKGLISCDSVGTIDVSTIRPAGFDLVLVESSGKAKYPMRWIYRFL